MVVLLGVCHYGISLGRIYNLVDHVIRTGFLRHDGRYTARQSCRSSFVL